MTAAAYHLDPSRGVAGLTVAPQPTPEPGSHQVVVRVLAASLNRRDLMLLDGAYPLSATPGIVPLSDGVGEVVAVGDKVTRASVGDRVTATYFVRWIDGPQRQSHVLEQYGATYHGMLATYAVLEEDSVVHVPRHLTDAEAATLTCAGVVAWAALTAPLPVLPGEAVLIVGSGGVALFGVQHAKMLGAEVISITSTADKAARLRDLGADEVIVRSRTPDWERAVLDRTGGDGVEHVLDAVGLPTLARSVRSGAYNARITMVGAMPAEDAPTGNPFGASYLSIRRIAVGSRVDFEAMNRSITEHKTRPVLDSVFSFDQAEAAYHYFRTGDPFGKVVVALP
ncbi:NAD(P)-dependent alcohol dehydrogenase [Nocardia sp. NBC_00881]|uniref:zinc-dependent alcohol dehydrogenase family protein n=1 Tax=Nocardia sp. NBC_00881 TaxID=2975995 RepID=UPI003863EBFC|nr:NAD(P)-dependent alcohol dehydrogenase [Nocardia sp. NBC_00881]